MIIRFVTGAGGVLLAGSLAAQLAFSGNTMVIDFDTTLSGVNNGRFTGGGFAPAPSTGQLDSDAWAITGLSDGDLAFGGTGSSGDFARGSSTGGVITGGIYAFQVGGAADVGLGFQPTTDDLTSGTITLKVQNTSGAPLTTVRVSYDLYCYNDQGRANSVKFSYSTDDTTYTAVSALDYTSPEAADSSPAWEETDRVATLSFSVAAADYFYLRWTTADVSGSGSRDEFALDDITVSVPEPGATAGVGALALTGLVLFRRRRAGA